MLTWRESLGQKYSDLPGVRKLHDFLFVHSHTGKVVMKVRELCYAGAWNDSTLKVLTMYDKFISLDRRPSYLPAFQPSLPISRPIVSISSSLPASASCTSNSGTTQQRKQSKCSVPGCDGSGHRNHAKWNEGHKTRAGCPIFHGVSAPA